MKSKLAIWGWILPLIGYGLYILSTFILNSFVQGRNTGIDILFIIVLVLGSTIFGLILGIATLIKISHDSKLSGKGHAIVSIVLNVILLLYGILMLFGDI
ncbi:MAG: hypothetical protein Q7S74_03070 [Nanoarchaeota archaeon]|nr:hypothetical protein [Nanoarchaeota archaeon]